VKTVRLCVEAGLVDGKKVHLDGSLIDAHATRESVLKADPETIARIKAAYHVQERKLDETTPPSARSETNRHLVSTTDPDAPCVTKGPASGPARPRYTHHRMVDERQGVITAIKTTPGDHPEAAQTLELTSQHESNTGRATDTLVADRGYGTAENYCDLVEAGIRPHISPFHRPKETGLYTKEDFRYDEGKDHYTCPAGQTLTRRRKDPHRQTTEYKAGKPTCANCPLREKCTTSKQGRTIARHWREESLQVAQALAQTPEAYQDRARRRHLMEGSFAQAANQHHFKKARWRRLWRQQIQDWLIAAVQNIAILCGKTKMKVGARLKPTPKTGQARAKRARSFFYWSEPPIKAA